MSRRPPPHIIRRRRVAGLIVLAILVSLIWWAVASIAALFGPPPEAEEAKVTQCAPGVVQVTALVGDGETRLSAFDIKTDPVLWFTLNNTGKKACTFNAGPKVQIYTIRIGDEVIWSNEQCDREGLKDQKITLTPGKEEKAIPSPWLKVYSNNAGCGEGQPAALPGSYTFSVSVNGVNSGNAETFSIE